LLASVGFVLFLWGSSSLVNAAEPPVDFNRDIRPILSDRCYTCHGPDENQRDSELRLDSARAALADLGGHRAIVPGDLTASTLWERVSTSDDSLRMPPPDSGSALTAAQQDLLRRWIEQGAKFAAHWSFVAPQPPALPEVKQTDWPTNDLDRFILARLEREGLHPSPPATREKLLRRVTFDLTGLPPTPEELDTFLADASPEAYERVVDRLLASPRYGEHMVRPWLDAARYSDTNGYQTDGTRAMWPWRDWVIAAINDNMPFDRFTIEQIAGDLLPNPTLEQLIATGFNRNHMLNGEGGRIAEESRVEYVVDRVDTTSTVWLGLTIGCARCHSHKYDPFTHREFYQLYAYFNNIEETGAVDGGRKLASPFIDFPTLDQKEKIATLEATLTELDQKLKEAAAGKTQTELQKERADAQQALDAIKKEVVRTMVMKDRQEVRPTNILLRGQYDRPGEAVTAGVPEVLHPLPAAAPPNRLALARWLIDEQNPLVARVTVNRIWQQFFGRGLVKTVEDFGSQGELPTHPKLLDWLALRFQADWNVKAFHKLLVMSATYRQTSQVSSELLERDPENVLLSRGPRYRLDAFQLRDQALAVSGLLVEQLGGPPVLPYQPAGIWEDFSFNKIKYVQDHGDKLYRRSLYIFWRRSVGPTMMFDTSARQVCTVRQLRTNTPLHALVLLNETTYVEAARMLGERLMNEGGSTLEERLAWGFRLLTARYPQPNELEILRGAYERAFDNYTQDRAAAEALLATGEKPRDTALDIAESAAYAYVGSLLLNLDEAINKE
jgi:hypothetical protein